MFYSESEEDSEVDEELQNLQNISKLVPKSSLPRIPLLNPPETDHKILEDDQKLLRFWKFMKIQIQKPLKQQCFEYDTFSKVYCRICFGEPDSKIFESSTKHFLTTSELVTRHIFSFQHFHNLRKLGISENDLNFWLQLFESTTKPGSKIGRQPIAFYYANESYKKLKNGVLKEPAILQHFATLRKRIENLDEERFNREFAAILSRRHRCQNCEWCSMWFNCAADVARHTVDEQHILKCLQFQKITLDDFREWHDRLNFLEWLKDEELMEQQFSTVRLLASTVVDEGTVEEREPTVPTEEKYKSLWKEDFLIDDEDKVSEDTVPWNDSTVDEGTVSRALWKEELSTVPLDEDTVEEEESTVPPEEKYKSLWKEEFLIDDEDKVSEDTVPWNDPTVDEGTVPKALWSKELSTVPLDEDTVEEEPTVPTDKFKSLWKEEFLIDDEDTVPWNDPTVDEGTVPTDKYRALWNDELPTVPPDEDIVIFTELEVKKKKKNRKKKKSIVAPESEDTTVPPEDPTPIPLPRKIFTSTVLPSDPEEPELPEIGFKEPADTVTQTTVEPTVLPIDDISTVPVATVNQGTVEPTVPTKKEKNLCERCLIM